MPAYSVKIENLAAIQAAFRAAPGLMAKNLNRAIALSVFEVEAESKIRTPVDTGYLRASHRTAFEPLKGTIQPVANYAIYVHEGTRYIRARPFLAEAVESKHTSINRRFKDAVQDTLDQIARRA